MRAKHHIAYIKEYQRSTKRRLVRTFAMSAYNARMMGQTTVYFRCDVTPELCFMMEHRAYSQLRSKRYNAYGLTRKNHGQIHDLANQVFRTLNEFSGNISRIAKLHAVVFYQFEPQIWFMTIFSRFKHVRYINLYKLVYDRRCHSRMRAEHVWASHGDTNTPRR